MAWLLLAALATPAGAVERPAALEGRCAGGRLSLRAVDAPAGKVFDLLAGACGVELRRVDLIPNELVTATYRDLPLDEAIRDLIRLTGIPGTLRVSSATGSLTVYFMPVGAEGPAIAAAGAAPHEVPASAAGGTAESGASGTDPRRAEAGGTSADAPPPWQQAIATLRELSAEEAWVLRNLDPQDFAEDRRETLAAEARRRFLLGTSQAERLDGLRDLGELDPAEAAELAGAGAEELLVLREEQAVAEARTAYLLAETPQEQERAMRALQRLDPFESRELASLPPGALAEERQEAAKERARRDYCRSLSTEEQGRLFRESQKRLPE